MQLSGRQTGRLLHLRRWRRGPAVLLALVSYLFTGAILPPGHMPAPLSSGTAFHLCPGDARSAWISGVLLATAPAGVAAQGLSASAAGDHHHHHQHVQRHSAIDLQQPLTGHEGHLTSADTPVLEASSTDHACNFAGSVNALAVCAEPLTSAAPGNDSRAAQRRTAIPVQRTWLRPPARSPPVA